MFDTLRKRSTDESAGCWRHTAIVGETSCHECGVRCCEHCWIEAPGGELCIECALVLAGVRAARRRGRRPDPGMTPAPLAKVTWEQSAGLIDLAPAYRRRQRRPLVLPEPSFFRRAA